MAKIKINDSEYDVVLEQVVKAQEELNSLEECWGTNFDNLYQRFITSGFLDDLYKDAESNYYQLANAGHAVASTAGGAGLGMAIGTAIAPGLGTIIGGVIGGVLGAIKGVVGFIKNPNSVKWSYESRDVFKKLLEDCVNGDEPNYTKIENLLTKLDNVSVSLIEIRTKINEYNHLYANLKASAESLGLKTTTANDGITVLSVDTEITVDGKKIELSVSDAMNAFYTYNETVINGEIEADYLAREYGADINYNDIVKNANSFMSKTIGSGLYSHEFVDQLLPSYNPSYNEAVNAVASPLGLTDSELEEALGSSASKYAGLIGASFIGKAIKKKNSEGGSTGDGNNPSGNNGNGGNSNPSSDSSTDDDKKSKAKKEKAKKSTEKESTVLEEVNPDLIKEIDNDLPETIVDETDATNYDDLAREQFESQSEEEIMANRANITEEANQLFEAEDKTALKEKLAEYGYDESDINTIIADRDLTVNAMIDGDQRTQLADIANELAAKDGVTDFDTSYDDNVSYHNLLNGDSEKMLTNITANDEYTQAKADYDSTYEEYNGSIEDTNKALEDVNSSSKDLAEKKNNIMNSLNKTENWKESVKAKYSEEVKDLKNSYIEKYGKTSKWSTKVSNAYGNAKSKLKETYIEKVKNNSAYWKKEVVEDYNKAVDGYNNVVTTAKEKYEQNTVLKEKVAQASTKINEVKTNILNNINTQDISTSNNISDPVSQTTVNISDDDLLNYIDKNGSSASIK